MFMAREDGVLALLTRRKPQQPRWPGAATGHVSRSTHRPQGNWRTRAEAGGTMSATGVRGGAGAQAQAVATSQEAIRRSDAGGAGGEARTSVDGSRSRGRSKALPMLLAAGGAAAAGVALLTLRSSSNRMLRGGAAAALALGGAALLGACGSGGGSGGSTGSLDSEVQAASERLRRQSEAQMRELERQRAGTGSTSGQAPTGGTSSGPAGNTPIGGTGPSTAGQMTAAQAAHVLRDGGAILAIAPDGVRISAALTLMEGRRQTLDREYESDRGYDADGNGRIGSDYTLRPGHEPTYMQGVRVFVGLPGQQRPTDFTTIEAAMQFMASRGATSYTRL